MKFTTLLATIAAIALSANAVHVTNLAGETHVSHKLAASQVKNEKLAQAKAGCPDPVKIVVEEAQTLAQTNVECVDGVKIVETKDGTTLVQCGPALQIVEEKP